MVYDELYVLHELAGGNDVMRARLASNAVHARLVRLESVAAAARALVVAANVTHWEDLGDEIRGLALTCDELDGPQPIPDKEAEDGKRP